ERARRPGAAGPAGGCGGRGMTLGLFGGYLPLQDLLEIVAACLVVAVAAPSAVTIAIVGLDRRDRAATPRSGAASGLALLALGIGIVLALIGLGLYTLFEH